MSLLCISNNLSIGTGADVLGELNDILGKSTAAVSVWGTRQIVYKGERVNFTEMAKKVASVANVCLEQDLDEIRRAEWISISHKISEFYPKTDRVVRNRNMITRLFVAIREFTLFSSLRFNYERDENGIKDKFCTYSEEGFAALKQGIGRALRGVRWDTTWDSSGMPCTTVVVSQSEIVQKAQRDRETQRTAIQLRTCLKSRRLPSSLGFTWAVKTGLLT